MKASEVTYIVVKDYGGVYEPNTIIKAGDLVESYIDGLCLNEENDRNVADWLNSYMNKDNETYAEYAVTFIADAWGIELKPNK